MDHYGLPAEWKLLRDRDVWCGFTMLTRNEDAGCFIPLIPHFSAELRDVNVYPTKVLTLHNDTGTDAARKRLFAIGSGHRGMGGGRGRGREAQSNQEPT
jgi:hypothetical protein